jgi:DNA-binding CsgD family transcriptional regulator
VRAGAGRFALALPGLSEVLRARHLACLVHNLMVSGRLDEAHEILPEARSAVASSGDGRAAFTLTFAEMAVEYSDDRLGRALELTVSARREGAGVEDDTRLRLAHMWHGEVLSDLDRYDEALAIAADGLVSAERDRQEWTFQNFETWHARMLFQTGRLSEAAVALERRFGGEDGSRAGGVLDVAGVVVLGQIAIHSGDTRRVRRVNDMAQVIWQRGTPAVRRHAGWLLSLIALSQGDCAAARDWIHAPFEIDGRPTLPRYPVEVTDEVHLARVGRAAQDDELASLALANARNRHDLNPNIASIAATYAQVRGVLGGSVADLEAAAALFEHSPRRLAYASALEDFGASLATTGRDRAIEVLGQALAVYTQVGAGWDARRVRGRLRELGVRRRIVSSETQENGWAAMTASELSVALLVAEGLTNREVAERLFVSPHTVNSHLRNIFQKLGINSRVELARLAGENG